MVHYLLKQTSKHVQILDSSYSNRKSPQTLELSISKAILNARRQSGTLLSYFYIYLSNSNIIIRFTHFTFLTGAHFEHAKGNGEQCETYCTKEESRDPDGVVVKWGERSLGAGRRNDIHTMVKAIRVDKRTLLELADDPETCVPAVKYMRAAERLINLSATVPDRADVRTIYHYGTQGVGKTRCAKAMAGPGFYSFEGFTNGFWNGYNGQTTLVLDEFSGCTLNPTYFQRLCDDGPLMLNIKGGEIPCQITTIHVISNFMPNQWWKETTRVFLPAVARRLTEVHYHYAYRRHHVFLTTSPTDTKEYALNKMLVHINTPGLSELEDLPAFVEGVDNDDNHTH